MTTSCNGLCEKYALKTNRYDADIFDVRLLFRVDIYGGQIEDAIARACRQLVNKLENGKKAGLSLEDVFEEITTFPVQIKRCTPCGQYMKVDGLLCPCCRSTLRRRSHCGAGGKKVVVKC